MTWFAIQHKPAQGPRAHQNLMNLGVHCYRPEVEVDKIVGGKRIRRLEALFPGYLFVRLELTDPVWAKLRSTRGVLRVVEFGGAPARIADEVIEQVALGLERVAEYGGILQGQPVEIHDGPFQGLQAIFQQYDGDTRAIVLIEFLQQQQRLKIPLSVLSQR